VIDVDGFRPNVGIMLANARHELLWARRIGQNAWQFPQGGIDHGESPEQALFRELHEEVGLTAEDVQVLGCTRGWLRYYLPKRFVRRNAWPRCIGQKTGLVPAAADCARGTGAARSEPEARIRPLALGTLLASHQRSRVLQAPGLPPRSAGT